MTQYARPNSDLGQTNWSGSYTTIDDAPSYNDSDYITGLNTANGTSLHGLSAISEPDSTKIVTIRFRACKSASAGFDRQVTAQVYEGATARGSSVNSGDLTDAFVEYNSSSIDLSAVTDWSALRILFTSTGDVGTPAPNRRYVYVSWFVLEAADAAAPSVNIAALAANSNMLIGV